MSIGPVLVFFFQKKKQKALFRFAEDHTSPKLGEADPGGSGGRAPQKSSSESLRGLGVCVWVRVM
jgi:hypothetical protein